ncbi:MAG TPA: Gfo/Idh/MocA family oxidoreductase [Actinomycetes bacterium]
MSTLRAGVVGLGMMGRHHVRVLRELDGVELVAVADPGGDPHGVAGGLSVLGSVAALVEVGVDLAVVAAPTGLHEELALELADAGIHTMIEKPLAADAKAAHRIVEAFQSKGLVGCVGHIERFNPALQELRSRLETGELGEVYQIVTRRQGPFPARIADVGVVKDLATHDIDLTAWVAQSPFTSISARVTHRSGRPHEDLVAAVGTLANGTVTSHLVNWLTPFKERVTIVTGDRGSFVADTLSADLTFHANGTVRTEWPSVASFRGVSEGDVTRFAYAKREPLRLEHEAFRDAVLGDASRIVTMEEGLRTVDVAEAMLTSARTGNAVDLS